MIAFVLATVVEATIRGLPFYVFGPKEFEFLCNINLGLVCSRVLPEVCAAIILLVLGNCLFELSTFQVIDCKEHSCHKWSRDVTVHPKQLMASPISGKMTRACFVRLYVPPYVS